MVVATVRAGEARVPWPVPLVAGGALLSFRLWRLGAAPFVYDEPIFLDAARSQLDGHWLTASPVTGTRGVPYGPSVFWLYGSLQWLVGQRPLLAIAAMCVLTTAAQVLLVAGLTRLARGGPALFLLLLLLVGSSPYLHLWSRVAWDQTVLICAPAAVGVLCWPSTIGVRHAVIVGLLMGLALSSHPMSVPFVAAVLGVVGWELRQQPSRAGRVGGAMVGSALLVNLPYLHHLATERSRGVAQPPLSEGLFDRLLQAPSVMSSARVEYLLDGGTDRLVDSTAGVGAALELRGVVLLVLIAGSIVGLVASWRDPDRRRRRIARCGGVTWILSVVCLALARVGLEPHYQFATWWVIPAGIALAVRPIRAVSSARVVAATGAAAVVGLNLLFVVSWTSFLSADGGTRGIRYGASLDNQQQAVERLCRGPESELAVVNETQVFQESLDYLISTTPACEGRDLRICADPCREASSWVRLRLAYAPDGSAELVVLDERSGS